MTKTHARAIYKEKRKNLPDAERARADDLMLIQFQTLALPSIHHLLSFWPIEENNEPNTHLFCDFLEFRNPSIRFSYPKSDFETKEMAAIEVNTDSAFEKTARNIHEPMDGRPVDPTLIDLVFVPLVIFDKKGFRVGYGQGFYDRFLSKCRPSCLKLGFSYFEPLDLIGDTSEFDVALNVCITPNNIYVF